MDRYLSASNSRDEDGFAAMWAYPIGDRYRTKGETEAQLRGAVRAYWERYPAMELRRIGPTHVTRSPGGWETSTPYEFNGVKQGGTRTCGTTTLYLGFDEQWLVRTAAEDKPTRTC